MRKNILLGLILLVFGCDDSNRFDEESIYFKSSKTKHQLNFIIPEGLNTAPNIEIWKNPYLLVEKNYLSPDSSKYLNIRVSKNKKSAWKDNLKKSKIGSMLKLKDFFNNKSFFIKDSLLVSNDKSSFLGRVAVENSKEKRIILNCDGYIDSFVVNYKIEYLGVNNEYSKDILKLKDVIKSINIAISN